jgi:hypothetical protein
MRALVQSRTYKVTTTASWARLAQNLSSDRDQRFRRRLAVKQRLATAIDLKRHQLSAAPRIGDDCMEL